MAEAISSGLDKIQDKLGNVSEGKKLSDLRHVTKDVHDPNHRLTTDYGVRQHNTSKPQPIGLALDFTLTCNS